MSQRHGLSRVGVLVVVLIGLVLIGLLIPAVMKAREHAARTSSSNNLRKICLAIHDYNDAQKNRLPPLIDIGTNAPTNAGVVSLFFHLLPHLGEKTAYDIYNERDPSTYYSPATGAAKRVINAFISPADTSADSLDAISADAVVNLPLAQPAPYSQRFTGRYAGISYAANGMIPWSTGGIPRTFVDGTSLTIMIAERPQACSPASGPTVYNLWGFGYYGPSTPAFALLTPKTPAGLPSTGQFAPVTPLPEKWTADPRPVRCGFEDAPSQPLPNEVLFQIGPASKSRPCDPRIPGTPHPDGMLVGLVDGSVRTVKPTINAWTFWAVLTPAGNEELYQSCD